MRINQTKQTHWRLRLSNLFNEKYGSGWEISTTGTERVKHDNKIANEIVANTYRCVDVHTNGFEQSTNAIWGQFTALL